MYAYESSGTIGSTDRQIATDINDHRKELRAENSPLRESWGEYQIAERAKNLGRYCDGVTLNHFGY